MSRKMFIGFGSFFGLIGIMYLSLGLAFNSTNAETGYTLLALAFVLFVNAYLFPHIRENDERAKTIRQKAFFYSYFISVGYILILAVLFQLTSYPLQHTRY